MKKILLIVLLFAITGFASFREVEALERIAAASERIATALEKLEREQRRADVPIRNSRGERLAYANYEHHVNGRSLKAVPTSESCELRCVDFYDTADEITECASKCKE